MTEYEKEGAMRKFEFEVLGMGMNNSGYPGAFTKPVQEIIKSVIYGKVLHLFSGGSLIGDDRIDISHPNATLNCDVKEFIASDKRHWDWVILDPSYNIAGVGTKLKGYGLVGSVSADVIFRRNLKYYFQFHAENILWLDICAPLIKGFSRQKLWLLLPGGYHTVRVLSWLKREMKPLL